MLIELNKLETDRFGIVAARVTDSQADPTAIDTEANDKGVRMLTARISASDLCRVNEFEAAGYRLMDTLVYYSRDLRELPTRPVLKDGLSIRQAVPEDARAVEKVARVGFTGYMGHYHADPRLDRSAADAAYVEWAETSTTRASLAAPVLVAEADGLIVGFLTLRTNNPEEMELVLSAVDPLHQGKGAYGALLFEAMPLAISMNCSRMISSTQINNYAVQRTWARLGFVHSSSFYTFHKWFKNSG